MKKITLLLAFFLWAWVIFAQNGFKATTDQLQEGKPSEVGMSEERLMQIDKTLQEYIDKKWTHGAVAIVARKGKIVYYKSFGTSGIGNDQAMRKDDLFRIMSMTKPITSVALMILYEEGKFLLDEPLSKYIPEFKNPVVLKTFNEQDSSYTTEPAKREITIRQILTHTSGIAYGFTDAKKWGAIFAKAKVPDFASAYPITIGEKMKVLAKLPLVHHPGEMWTYGLNTDVCGYLVEVLSGMTLSDFCEKRIFQPLGMNETHYFWNESEEKRLVRVYTEKEGLVAKETNPDLLKMVEYPVKGAKKYFSGGSGLTSTALDYLKFCQFILNGGTYNGKRLLSRKTIELMTKNQIGDLAIWGGSKFGLGFSISTEKTAAQKLGSVGRLGWGGALSTHFWIDPKEEIVGVLMMQIFSSTHNSEIYDKFENATYQSIID
ncbi:serine hydrolase domain-containing protein [Thermoflexibacter ruber]|uniref:CubicO group peptidase, beta-lactamase class C family n=1 Tax=Thermoflexibacter ruber TaxID=1003 RepID=A0A1I2I6X2_9BACT|nr:serine hydrolase domain-containing protein [Thermoflexibacter ruber]SFF36251.1 CubicO group peptidase, beta-lactamase class C family [Thermoflexibacter ruber]